MEDGFPLGMLDPHWGWGIPQFCWVLPCYWSAGGNNLPPITILEHFQLNQKCSGSVSPMCWHHLGLMSSHLDIERVMLWHLDKLYIKLKCHLWHQCCDNITSREQPGDLRWHPGTTWQPYFIHILDSCHVSNPNLIQIQRGKKCKGLNSWTPSILTCLALSYSSSQMIPYHIPLPDVLYLPRHGRANFKYICHCAAGRLICI